jgi:7-alpha-hydroxysteroid dehydrogenase
MTILDRFRLDDHVAIVTGAGRGIGAASAVALAEAGADVLISSRTESQLAEVKARIEGAGRRCVIVPADLTDLDAIAGLAQIAVDELGRLDVVINNVGGSMPATFLDTGVKMLKDEFAWNVSTAHALSHAAVPLMLASDTSGGQQQSITNISSLMGRAAGRGFLAYGTAKGALAHWSRLAAQDLAPRIRVNAIMVGSIMTSALEFVATDETVMGQFRDLTPMGDVGEPEDIAAAVVYLSSKAGKYVTGKCLEVDGGLQQPNMTLGLPDLS